MSNRSRASEASVSPTLILVAMEEEAAPLLSRLEDAQELQVPFSRGASGSSGTIGGSPVVVVTTGIGMSAASAVATWAILTAAPSRVISAGSCGGLAADVEVGTVVVGESFAGSLADATAFGYAPGQVPGDPERFTADADLVTAAVSAAEATGSPVRSGLMLSGDAFVTAEIAEPMRARFPGALSADMETTAIARTCEVLEVPFVAVRAISDLCGPAAGQQFHIVLDVAAEASAAAVTGLLTEGIQRTRHHNY